MIVQRALVQGLECYSLGLLGCMRMFSAAVDFQFGEEATPQSIFREHSTDRGLNEPFRSFLAHLPSTRGTDSAGVACMTMVQFSFSLGTGKRHLRRIDDDHKITNVLMRGEIGTMLAPQDHRCPRSDASE
jgi:hypothetical protein